ncbi:bacteriocin-like protein [Chryseobacterium sp. 2987]|uniref:bacteriocin-like protein n=1 Tax=Chryseobacterium sp. 2987 TaxID=2817767 RepID=UPI0038D3D95E
MKNLRKLSKGELKTIQGGIQSCEPWMTVCPCRPGFHRCEPKGACIPATTMC